MVLAERSAYRIFSLGLALGSCRGLFLEMLPKWIKVGGG